MGVIEFEGLAHPTINGKPTTQTITVSPGPLRPNLRLQATTSRLPSSTRTLARLASSACCRSSRARSSRQSPWTRPSGVITTRSRSLFRTLPTLGTSTHSNAEPPRATRTVASRARRPSRGCSVTKSRLPWVTIHHHLQVMSLEQECRTFAPQHRAAVTLKLSQQVIKVVLPQRPILLLAVLSHGTQPLLLCPVNLEPPRTLKEEDLHKTSQQISVVLN